VPVVQAYCYSKYLGRFDLYFDSKGELKLPVESVGVKNASPILLDKSIAEDEDVLKVIDEYRLQMTEYTKTMGSLATKLRKGGDYESNIGDALADSMVMAGEWKDEATIAFMNNGGIRYCVCG
jgi:5'-nucleotidase